MKLIDFLLILIFTGVVIYCIETGFSTPVVYWSTSSNECVKVIYDGYETGCQEMPEKYSRVWVE